MSKGIYRAIRDTTPYSETLTALSDFAERLFWRMLSRTDPWGRLPGSPMKIATLCIPTMPERFADIPAALDELLKCGRIVIYGGGRDGLACQLVDFDEHQPGELRRQRNVWTSKFPAPPDDAVTAARTSSAAIREAKTPANIERAKSKSERESFSQAAVARPLAQAAIEKTLEGAGELHSDARATRAESRQARRQHAEVMTDLRETRDGLAAVPERFRKLAAMARDADATSARTWAIHSKGLPESAIGRAEEALRERLGDRAKGPLVSPAGYVTAMFKRMREERQYA